MHIKSDDFRVRKDAKVNLREWPTRVDPAYGSDEEYQDLLRKHVKALSSQQELLYASDRYAVLLIFQAMDAAGKDGAIRHVMSGVSARLPGVQFQASQRGRIETRFSLANDARLTRARTDRYFQPLLLRGAPAGLTATLDHMGLMTEELRCIDLV